MSDLNEDTAVFAGVQRFAELFFAQSWKDIPITFGAASDVGKKRLQNEDHFAIFRLHRTTELLLANLAPEDQILPESCSYGMAVADGMGGMKSGEYASRLAVQTMLELAGHATSWVMKFADLDAQQIRKRVDAYVERIHATLQEQGRSDPSKTDMGTTWTSAHLLGQHAIIVHLGDSRAYLVRGGQLLQITRDQTMAQELIDSGLEPSSVSGFSHVLVNSLGGGHATARATIDHLELISNDQLLLCTDGLTDMVPEREIAAQLRRHSEPQSTCDALVERALENGGKDNVTVALASIGTLST